MNVSEFSRNPGGEIAEVDRTGLPLPITTRGREQYTTIVRTEDWQRAERAQAIVQGLMAIARADQGRTEDCDQYRRFAEMLSALNGQLQVSTDADHEVFAALLRDLADELHRSEREVTPTLALMSS
ncbi:hypothetical protein [Saccharopolyspora shandongensis]|uniref:hypothetical protein n=1 Tax=Saccharopolyspora shandongensis TaxID=418495 RepID=UPI0033FF5072